MEIASITTPQPLPRLWRHAGVGRWALPFVLFVLPFTLVCWRPGPTPVGELLIDIAIGDSPTMAVGLIEVYLNDTLGEPLRQPVEPGVRHTYRFALTDYQTIHFIRLDPTWCANVPTRLYGIRIECQGESICQFTAQDLSKWQTTCEHSVLQADALVQRAKHQDPFVYASFPDVQLPVNPEESLARSCWNFLFRNDSPTRRILLLALSALAVLGLGLLGRVTRIYAVIVGLSIPLTYGVLLQVNTLGGKPPATEVAVGYAAYAGYPTSLGVIEVALLFCLPVLVAGVCLYLSRRWSQVASLEAGPLPTALATGPRRAGAILMTLLVAALACFFFPDLEGIRTSFTLPFPSNWDGDNCLVWDYLLQVGQKPFRDFWYPYAGHAFFRKAFPNGEILHALHQFALFTILLLTVYLNTARSVPATLAIFGTILGLYLQGFFLAVERYGVIVTAILAYVAIDQEARRLQWRHVLFWFAIVEAVVLEPSCVIYAGLPILVSWCLEAVRSPGRFWEQLGGRLCRDFAPPAAVFAAIASGLAVSGQLAGFLEFMASFSSISAYGAFPFELPLWLRCEAASESFVIWSVVALTGVGFGQLLSASPLDRKTGQVVFLLGLAGTLVLLKQFVRPHMAQQILFIDTVGVLYYLFAHARRFNLVQRSLVVFAAGLFFTNIYSGPAIRAAVDRVSAIVPRVQASAPLVKMKKRDRRAVGVLRYAPSRFRVSEGHQAVFRVLTDLSAAEGRQPYFVLSDDALFYVLLGVPPYFHTNFYNAAPIQEQRRVVKMLEANPPRVVIWRADDPGMDGVPPVVRNPLVYEYMIKNYVPHARLHQFDLLRPRLPGQPVAIDFWRQRLGNVVHLGHIPRFSKPTRLGGPTEAVGEKAAEVLTIRLTDPNAVAASSPPSGLPELPPLGGHRPTGRPLAIPVECAGHNFTLVLSVVPGQAEYHVRLDRVWFWGALRRAGLAPTLGPLCPGIEVELVVRNTGDAEVLY